MPRYEYKVLPAPTKGTKAKGVKTPEGRFALSVEQLLNQMGTEGWEYQRAELLPSDERTGLTGSTVNWRNVLVFRKAIDAPGDAGRTETPAVESPAFDPEEHPIAKPIPGPEAVQAPAPISQEVKDPPLQAEVGEAPEFLSSRGDEGDAKPPEDQKEDPEKT